MLYLEKSILVRADCFQILIRNVCRVSLFITVTFLAHNLCTVLWYRQVLLKWGFISVNFKFLNILSLLKVVVMKVIFIFRNLQPWFNWRTILRQHIHTYVHRCVHRHMLPWVIFTSVYCSTIHKEDSDSQAHCLVNFKYWPQIPIKITKLNFHWTPFICIQEWMNLNQCKLQ